MTENAKKKETKSIPDPEMLRTTWQSYSPFPLPLVISLNLIVYQKRNENIQIKREKRNRKKRKRKKRKKKGDTQVCVVADDCGSTFVRSFVSHPHTLARLFRKIIKIK